MTAHLVGADLAAEAGQLARELEQQRQVEDSEVPHLAGEAKATEEAAEARQGSESDVEATMTAEEEMTVLATRPGAATTTTTMKPTLTRRPEVVTAVVPRQAVEATGEEEAALRIPREAAHEMMHLTEEATEKHSLRKLSRQARKRTVSMSETYRSRSDGTT